jgi:cysteine desulfurase / selenocysteine lyase
MTFDVERARQDTPATSRLAHFNNAGASLMPQPVVDAVVGHLQLEAEIGGYEAADQVADRLQAVYSTIGQLLGCGPDEIAVCESATRAWDMLFYALPFQANDRILTGTAEYVSNYLAMLQVCRRVGATIEVLPNDEHGQVSVDALREALDERVKLVAITHAPSHGGLVNPAAAIGRVTRSAGVPYLLDACQSVGQLDVNVDDIGCDFLCATGRKYLRGPRGTGFLYVRRNWLERLEPPFIDLQAARWTTRSTYELRADARRFESWESSIAAKLGLGTAVEYALSWGLESITDRVRALAAGLRARLRALPRVDVLDTGEEQSGIVTFNVAGVAADEVRKALADQQIHVGLIARNRLEMDVHRLEWVVRASVHYFNTEDEVERLCAALADLPC